jgi:hypothetical protein
MDSFNAFSAFRDVTDTSLSNGTSLDAPSGLSKHSWSTNYSWHVHPDASKGQTLGNLPDLLGGLNIDAPAPRPPGTFTSGPPGTFTSLPQTIRLQNHVEPTGCQRLAAASNSSGSPTAGDRKMSKVTGKKTKQTVDCKVAKSEKKAKKTVDCKGAGPVKECGERPQEEQEERRMVPIRNLKDSEEYRKNQDYHHVYDVPRPKTPDPRGRGPKKPWEEVVAKWRNDWREIDGVCKLLAMDVWKKDKIICAWRKAKGDLNPKASHDQKAQLNAAMRLLSTDADAMKRRGT